MSSFKSLVTISPLGFMYASSGGFLSIGSLVGKSNYKFPPDSAAMAGLILGANQIQNFMNPSLLQQELVVAGPFWASTDDPKAFYVPIPRHRIIDAENSDEWSLVGKSDQSESKYLQMIDGIDHLEILKGQHRLLGNALILGIGVANKLGKTKNLLSHLLGSHFHSCILTCKIMSAMC